MKKSLKKKVVEKTKGKKSGQFKAISFFKAFKKQPRLLKFQISDEHL